MLAFFCFIKQTYSWQSMSVNRFIEYSSNETNGVTVGSTRANVNSFIGSIDTKPDSKQAIFVDLENYDRTKLLDHLNQSSPIIFYVPDKEVDTKELETILLSHPQKSPVYFAYGQKKIHSQFSHVKTQSSPSNNPNKKSKLQNIVGTINSSKTFDRERIAIITAPYDTFSPVPNANVGANKNGIALAALLESMRLVSKFPLTNNWCLVFAVVDGHFCNNEGLDKFLQQFTQKHSSKIEFAISLEDISSPNLKGHFSMKLQRDSSFTKFMHCLKDAFNQTGIPFTNELSEEKHGQAIFGQRFLKAISITSADSEETEWTSITDSKPNIARANAVAWAVSEALLRMMYDADTSATMVELSSVNTSYWARAVTIPRMPLVRDRSFTNTISQWMKRFGTVSIEDWTSNKCPVVHSATKTTLILYNETPFSTTLILYGVAVVYGIVALLVASRGNLKKIFS